MNIVHIHEKFLPYQSGSTHRLLNLINGINKITDKYKTIVVCWDAGDKTLQRYEVYDAYNLTVYRFTNYYEIPKILFKLNKKIKIDLFQIHNFRPSFYTLLANFILRKKVILELHAIYKTTNIFKQFIGEFIIQQSKNIILLSNNSKISLLKNFNINEENLYVIYNGIEQEETMIPDDFEKKFIDMIKFKKQYKKIYGYFGSFHNFQGVTNIIKIAQATNKDIGFMIIGSGTQEELIEKQTSRMENIFYHSAIDGKYKWGIYSLFDYLIMPRPDIIETQTAIPLKPIEALIMHKRVISTNVGGMLELRDTLKSENILLFETLEDIINFCNIDVYKHNTFIKEDNINIFDNKLQANGLIKLYESINS